jgi:serine/threonine-protein kinase HipA
LAAPHTLITLSDNTTAYLIRRCGREKDQKLLCKTFSQILGKEDKHDGTLEEIGEKIKRISEIPGLDVQLFFEMVLLSFILGHGDLHLDKFSVFYDEKKIVRLAPLEDMASTKLFRPDEPDFAMPMMGKTNDITGSDFQEFARHLKIYPKSYDKMFLRFFKGKRLIGRRIKHSALEMDEKLTLSDIVNERFKRLLQ